MPYEYHINAVKLAVPCRVSNSRLPMSLIPGDLETPKSR